jgi:hypothetical protein
MSDPSTSTRHPSTVLSSTSPPLKRLLYQALKYIKRAGTGKKGYFLAGIAAIGMGLWLTSFYWGQEPDFFDVQAVAQQHAHQNAESGNQPLVVGYVSTYTLIYLTETLLNKSGGYLSNDVMPPSVMMDDMPNWEFGVVKQIRDFAEAMRDDLSRSQSQSQEDRDLSKAEPQFKFQHNSWMIPATETEYKQGVKNLHAYLERLNRHDGSALFFSRADNLRDWFKTVEKRLGSLSQRLSASIKQTRENTDLAGETQAESSSTPEDLLELKTPWIKIDDVFYEARGTAWALLHLLRAIEVDFRPVLENKNALASLRQIIRELESTQTTVWSPLILNGSEFGLFANHSLVMSSYISRANAMIIDLRSLLAQG